MSTINIKYSIHKKAIQDTFNKIISAYLSDEISLDVSGFDVVLKKEKEAWIGIKGKEVTVQLPLDINVRKDIVINELRAYGKLTLTFKSLLNVQPNWVVQTKTVLESYVWSESPRIDFGIFKMPIEKLSNAIIDKSKPTFEKEIDSALSSQLNLRGPVLDIMNLVDEPYFIEGEFNTWLHFRPENVILSDIRDNGDMVSSNITVRGITHFSSEKPQNLLMELEIPPVEWQKDIESESSFNVILRFSFEQINTWLDGNYQKQVFSDGDHTLSIDQITLGKHRSKVMARTRVSGTFNGLLLITGIPVFNNEDQVFYADDLDIKIQTDNVLHKAAGWMLRGKIKKELSKLLQLPLNDYMHQFQGILDEYTDNLNDPGSLQFKAQINNVFIRSFEVDDRGIRASVNIKMLLQSDFYDMRHLETLSLPSRQ